MKDPTPIFELINAHKRFGDTPALHDLNLQIGAGERVALVGSSGAGKSTLIRMLNGSLLPSDGQVYLLGQDAASLKGRQLRRLQSQIGTIYQQFHLVDTLQVVHNVNAGHLGEWSFLKSAVSLVKPLEVTSAYSALERVGIPEKLYARTDQLSGGQQQRVAIARVMVQNPPVILADEPISSLDPERSRDIIQLLVDLSQNSGKTLLASLHAVEFALSHFQRIIALKFGRLFFDLPADQVTPALTTQLYNVPGKDLNG